MGCEFGIVTLCGSTRFKEHFLHMQETLTFEGHIVLTPGVFSTSAEKASLSPVTIKLLKEIHKAKIDMSTVVLVMNVDGYIGDGTQEEIDYAISKGKSVIYYRDITENTKEVKT